MRTFLAGLVLILVPEGWRRGSHFEESINWREAAVVSGLLQAITALTAYVFWYIYSAGHWAQNAIAAAVRAHTNLHVGSGTIGSLAFVVIALHPITWLLWYFAIEGLMRTLNARARMETRATLPLRVVDRAVRFAKHGEWSRPPLRDEVTRTEGNWDLKIASRKSKPHWKYPLTIRYSGEFFQVQGEEHVAMVSSRPHIYLLRRLPANEILRGLEEYDPIDAFVEDNPPGFLATVYGEMRKKFAK
ncbi:MAG: hypothetical protein ACRD4V_04240 [Candidatus Acidiferrales bacterium]